MKRFISKIPPFKSIKLFLNLLIYKKYWIYFIMDNKENIVKYELDIDKELQNGPTRNRKITDCLFCIIMLAFWIGTIFVFAYSYSKGDPWRLAQPYDLDGNACGLDSFKDYPSAYFY